MLLNKLGCFLTIVFIAGNIWVINAKKLNDINDREYAEIVRSFYPGKDIWHFKYSSMRISVYYSNDLHFILLTSDYSSVRGYRGISRLMLNIKADGEIGDIILLGSEDTPRWVDRIKASGFLRMFIGDKNNLEERIDAVSGATMTCNAIMRAVTDSIEKSRSLRKIILWDTVTECPVLNDQSIPLKEIKF